MKTKLAILALCVSALTVQADLIDLTPGGFSWNNQPAVFTNWLYNIQSVSSFLIAGANVSGNTATWSPFCLFGPPNFGATVQQPNANVEWHLANTGGYFLQYVFVGGVGEINDNLYVVRNGTKFDGSDFVTIDGSHSINEIVFYGTNIVPDEANAGALFVLAIGALLLTYEAQRPRNA